MSVAERNGSCPCGSGAKYKRCCLPLVDGAVVAQRARDRVASRLVDWVQAEHGSQLDEAFASLSVFDRFRGGDVWQQALVTWALIDFCPSDGRGPLAQRYAALPGADAREATRLASAHIGVYRVVGAAAGAWVELERLDGGPAVRVMSDRVSAGVDAEEIVLARVMSGSPTGSVWGPVHAFPSESAARWEAQMAASAELAGVDPGTAALSLLRFQPDDHAAPLPPNVRLAEEVVAIEDDELACEVLEELADVASLGLEIGAGDGVWAFAWLASRGAGGHDLGGCYDDPDRHESARILVHDDRRSGRRTRRPRHSPP